MIDEELVKKYANGLIDLRRKLQDVSSTGIEKAKNSAEIIGVEGAIIMCKLLLKQNDEINRVDGLVQFKPSGRKYRYEI